MRVPFGKMCLVLSLYCGLIVPTVTSFAQIEKCSSLTIIDGRIGMQIEWPLVTKKCSRKRSEKSTDTIKSIGASVLWNEGSLLSQWFLPPPLTFTTMSYYKVETLAEPASQLDLLISSSVFHGLCVTIDSGLVMVGGCSGSIGSAWAACTCL